MADAEPGEIGGERRGVREAEAGVELQAVGRARDRRRAGVRHLRSFLRATAEGRPRHRARRHRARSRTSAPPTDRRCHPRRRHPLPQRPALGGGKPGIGAADRFAASDELGHRPHRRPSARRRAPSPTTVVAPAGVHPGQPRHDLRAAARPARGGTSEPARVRLPARASLPVELGRGKGRVGQRVGDALARRRVLELRKAGELVAPALAHGIGEIGPEIAEEREGLRRRPFLAHEQHRHLRQQQVDGGDGAHRLGRRRGRQPVAEGAVADLVVVLDERDEGGRRQARAGLAARCRRDRA